ncbi:MAG: Dps family protein [Candidatus Woesearchaeota archaeon]
MDIGIKDVKKSETILHEVLANQHIYYQKLRNYHWNVQGPHFQELHALFEQIYTQVSEDIDVVAERIRSLGVQTTGNFSAYLVLATLKEPVTNKISAQEMLQDVLQDTEELIVQCRQKAEILGAHQDTGNEDVLIGMMQTHEKHAWFLRALLDK